MPSINLEQQRKRAKDLRRAHARGDRSAGERIAQHLPRARGMAVEPLLATPFTLSEAQFVIARGAGFASWPALRKAVAPPAARSDDELIEAALRGDRSPDAASRVAAVVERALAGRPDRDVASSQRADALALAATCGDAAGVAALLA